MAVCGHCQVQPSVPRYHLLSSGNNCPRLTASWLRGPQAKAIAETYHAGRRAMRLRRLTMMAAGYVAACCVAAIVIVIALLCFTTSQSPFVPDLELVLTTTLLAAFVAGFVAVLGLLPFLVAVVYAKRNGITSPAWYVVTGAVAGVVALSLNLLLTARRGGISLSDLSDHPVFATLSGVAMVATVAGIFAGYTYLADGSAATTKEPELANFFVRSGPATAWSRHPLAFGDAQHIASAVVGLPGWKPLSDLITVDPPCRFTNRDVAVGTTQTLTGMLRNVRF